jgi:hypothetical protein
MIIPSPRRPVTAPAPSDLNADRFIAAVVAAIGSIALHSALFAPWLLAGRAVAGKTPPPLQIGAPASAEQSTTLTAMFVNEDEAARSNASQLRVPNHNFVAAVSLSHLFKATGRLPELIPESSVRQDDSQMKASATEAAGDEAGRAMLFGRYLGQISARISRAWMRPRTSLPGDSFECRVRITQDRRGGVQEVMLEACTADNRWQLSLAHAIESASPLPAPPDPQLFTPTVTLDFESAPYSASANPDGFEPVFAASVANTRSPDPVDHQVLDTLRALPAGGSGVIDLKIIGTQTSAVRSDASPPVSSPARPQGTSTP